MVRRTVIQLLSEFLGRQKIRLVGVGVSKLKEIDERQTLVIDFVNRSKVEDFGKKVNSLTVKRHTRES